MTGTLMSFDEWLRTSDLRRELVRRIGASLWWSMSNDECDAAVRDAEVRGVDTAAQEVLGR